MDTLLTLLAWCSVINLSFLLLWFALFVLLHDWIYTVHSNWFAISVEHFDMLHYGGMLLFKLGFILFNLVPYLVLRSIY